MPDLGFLVALLLVDPLRLQMPCRGIRVHALYSILKHDACRLKVKERDNAGFAGRNSEDTVGVDVDDPGKQKGKEDLGVAG